MRRATAVLLLLVACRAAQERKNREGALQQDLIVMRKAISDFRAANKRGPHSLAELETAHFLRKIPKDPITMSADWRVTTEAAVQNNDFASGAVPAEPEVLDVHSRAAGRDGNGKLYSEY
jgi:hypothetical protein